MWNKIVRTKPDVNDQDLPKIQAHQAPATHNITFVPTKLKTSVDLGMQMPVLFVLRNCCKPYWASHYGPRGGIGRRAWFRSMCRKVWGFESLRGHQVTGVGNIE